MKHHPFTTRGWAWAAAATLLTGLAGCGNNPAEAEPTAVAIPTNSSLAYSQFVGSRAPQDAAEPLEVDGLMPPSSDTDEPMALAA
jgi:hypothetical protein